MSSFLLTLALATGGASIAWASPAPAATGPPAARAEVLVLGTYHMANPGRDIVNLKVDDVLAPKRQTEIAQLLEVLKRFNPTKIALEGALGNERIPKRYSDYLGGKYELSANEVDQIGFRLAKQLGHKAVFPVDVDGDFPYPRVVSSPSTIGATCASSPTSSSSWARPRSASW